MKKSTFQPTHHPIFVHRNITISAGIKQEADVILQTEEGSSPERAVQRIRVGTWYISDILRPL